MKSRNPAYPSDELLTDEAWRKIETLVVNLPGVRAKEGESPAGRTPSIEPRTVVRAILYQACTGIPWRFLPHDIYPSYASIYNYARHWRKEGVIDKIYKLLGVLPPPPKPEVPRARRFPVPSKPVKAVKKPAAKAPKRLAKTR